MKNHKDEELHYLDQKALWLFFLSYFLRVILYIPLVIYFIYIIIVIFMLQGPQKPNSPDSAIYYLTIVPLTWLLLYLVIGIGITYLFARLSYINWRYGLTPDVMRIEKGIIWKRYVSIPYERIQNVDILRGILTRLLGLSDIQIQTAGTSFGPGFSAFSEGRLPGLSVKTAEQLRDQLVRKAKGKSGV